jgi:hypothetical protein
MGTPELLSLSNGVGFITGFDLDDMIERFAFGNSLMSSFREEDV